MRTTTKFALYYRPWLIASIAMMGFITLVQLFGEHPERVLSSTVLIVAVGGVATLTLGVGGIYHWFGEKGRPRRRKKLFDKLVNRKLEDLGLKPDMENLCYAGHFKAYYLTLTPDCNLEEYDILRINAFIVAKYTQLEILTELGKKYEFENQQSISFLTYKIKLPFGTIPDSNKISREIETLVDDLKYNQIEPLIVTTE